MRVISVFCIALAFSFTLVWEDDFWKSPHAFVDQSPPGDVPKLFQPPHLVDSGYFPLGRVAFSADGKEFFYGVNDSYKSKDHLKLCAFRFVGGHWEGPLLIIKGSIEPFFVPDGGVLMVNDNSTIGQMTRTASGWEGPRPFLTRPYSLYNYMLTKSGRAYLGTNGDWAERSDFPHWQFSVMSADTADHSVKSLGAPLNSAGFNGDFYIAADESYMIISAKESPTFESELWISFRHNDDSWTAPVSLGPAINDGVAHRFGQYVTPDGRYLFYTKGQTGHAMVLYWVRWDGLLKKLKAEAGIE